MLAVWLRWVAGTEIFLGSCEICLSLPNSFLLLFDLAVPSAQGVPVSSSLAWEEEDGPSARWGGAQLLSLQECPRNGITDLCPVCGSSRALCGAPLLDRATCLGWDESLGSQNWSETLPGRVQAGMVQPPLPL